MDNILLKIDNLRISFKDQGQLKSVVAIENLTINKGECVALVGESGSGKTLAALAVMQLLPQAAMVSVASKILFNGENLLDVAELNMRKIRGSGIGMIFQDAMSALNPVFSIGQQILEVLRQQKKFKRAKGKKQALLLLQEVGIDEPLRCFASYPHQLSGGMRQRAMIAMALAGEPTLLIADEPTTALDVTLQAQILELINQLRIKRQMSVLFISHDLAVVSQVADRVVVIRQGSLIEENTVKNFFKNPQHTYSRDLLKAIPTGIARQQVLSATETKSLLSVNNLKVYFPICKGLFKRAVDSVKALDGVDFNLVAGQTLALVGESGSGKTTVGKAILRLLPEAQGSISFQDKNINSLSKRLLLALRGDMQMIFQDPYSALDPRMLIMDSIAEGLWVQHLVKNRQQMMQQVDSLLRLVHLDPSMKWRYPHEFSGGQRQRICIARALALKPKLLILDEPTSALDVSLQIQILKLLEDLQKKLGLSYILITHNIAVVAYLAHYTAVMYRGKIVEQGATATVLENPQHSYTKKLLACVPEIMNENQDEQ